MDLSFTVAASPRQCSQSQTRDYILLSQILDSPNLVKVKVTLRLTVSQSVCLGVEPRLGLMTRYLGLF
jgi:hypothetical protein